MICVECGKSIQQVFKMFGKGNIRLSRCKSCHSISDKYVEYEFVLIFIDLLLHKTQVYRHLIFNRLEFSEVWIPRQLLKFLLVLFVLDTYKAILLDPSNPLSAERYSAFEDEGFNLSTLGHDLNLLLFHFGMFLGVVGDFFVYTATIILIVTLQLNMNSRCGELTKYNYIFVAIIVSTFGRGVLLFMLVWDYPVLFIRGVDIFVLTSNVVALQAFLDSSWPSVLCAVIPAHYAKIMFHSAVGEKIPALLALAKDAAVSGSLEIDR